MTSQSSAPTPGSPEVTLLYFDGCPNWQVTDARLHEALARAGRADVQVARRRISTPEEAEVAQFRGSPTVLVDGRDPFADPDSPVGLSCRVYRTPDGLAGAPTVDQLVAVLR
ncbi:MAG: thioredoxin family protein [Actinomycetota bacterium]|nr:thioredoxin family protein [Actinomycetota bacterium]